MRINNRAENFEKIAEVFQEINFSAWDFTTIAQSLIDYLKINFNEDFNDLISSSELISIIETFAYVGELIAYRLDLNSNENFINLASKKESVLRLARLVSYTASRNIPARGLVKLSSISTTERIFDSRGLDLSNRIINWNDSNNSNWKEQFILVINRILEQNFGTVLPFDRVQVQDVLFEIYGLNNEPLNNETIRYNISISGKQFPMELVSAELNSFGPLEKRPINKQKLNILFLNDGLGDSSETTGFFFLTKQGQLEKQTNIFDGVTPNQTFDILVKNTNETDVWVNNINPDTGEIISGNDSRSDFNVGEWERVDLANSRNILFNTNPNRNKYEVETLENDQFRLIFGDGQFSNIPSGTFDIWYRISANEDLIIPTNAIQNLSSSIFYIDNQNKQQTFTFTFSLTNTIQNASISEDIEHIRRTAPSVFYTQDRMVNARDYNEFMLQDNSILKLKAVNRTFAGDSKYIDWHDPTGTYENVKLYGEDLVIYFKNLNKSFTVNNSDLPPVDGGLNNARIDVLINNYIQPLLSSDLIYIKSLLKGVLPANYRRKFTDSEITSITNQLISSINALPSIFYITYTIENDLWSVSTFPPSDTWITVTAQTNGNFNLFIEGNLIVAHSDNVKFYSNNDGIKILNYDTLNNNIDNIVLLKANIGVDGILTQNYKYFILRHDIIDSGPNLGDKSFNDLIIIPIDSDNDGAPDNLDLEYLIDKDTDFVYFERLALLNGGFSQWFFREATDENVAAWQNDQEINAKLWKREIGRDNLNFLWLHNSPKYHLIDPSTSNIIDTYIITRGYYNNLRMWLNNLIPDEPEMPSSFELQNSYNYLIENKTLSDTIVLNPGKIKIIIGNKSKLELQGKFKVIKKLKSNLTNNQIKTQVVNTVNEFFDINFWDFGKTFYQTELISFIHNKIPDIDSIIIIPLSQNNILGDLFQVFANDDEVIQPNISVNDIDIVDSVDPRTLKR